MKIRGEAVGLMSEEAKNACQSDWHRNLAVGALALSLLTGACGTESPEENYVPDAVVVQAPDDEGYVPDLNRGSTKIDVNLEYKPEDYPPDSEAFWMPTDLEECKALIIELEDVDRYEDFLRYLAGGLQLTQEAWPHVRSGMHFYCDLFELEYVCATEYEELIDPHTYIAGCHEAWVDGEYYHSVMHLPLYEGAKLIISHEILHAIQTLMPRAEWLAVSDLLVEAFVQLDSKEIEALTIAGAFAAFSTFEIDDRDGETVVNASINFNDESHVEEIYALVGTLFSHLPSDLEKHYARYFADRQAIVRMQWEDMGMDYYFMQLQDN